MQDNDKQEQQPQQPQQPQPEMPVEKPREIPVVPIPSREQLNEGVQSTPKGGAGNQEAE
jgi:hypothetical protein